MATRYLEILSAQRPFPFNVDANKRTMFSCNYVAVAAAPANDFEEDMVRLLHLAGAAVQTPAASRNIWIGPATPLPTTDGPFSLLINTGGAEPAQTHDGAKYERVSFQVVTVGRAYSAARDAANAIWRALDGQRGVVVAGPGEIVAVGGAPILVGGFVLGQAPGG